ncbi:CMT1A duplicated region transcript 4 protein [Gracilinanus agilis]|uniref:CMT1A duplicated region transcript 4 protein n=1 Tax=Gracilinanus agilis TaxID=191870 RepID=UPI001CFF1F9D|nr:CMT1A duplicated region transcript 4 protein [Gracilinanus agilis]
MHVDPLECPHRITSTTMDHHNRSSANIGLPLNLIDKHEPWPAYVTYTSPIVNRLIEQERMRQLDYQKSSQENKWEANYNNKPGIIHLSRKPAKFSADVTFKEHLTTSVPVLGSYSSLAAPQPVIHGTFPQMASKGGPTEAYNSIIFSRKPMMRIFLYGSRPDSKEKKIPIKKLDPMRIHLYGAILPI